jgi:hypothetical protein
MTATHEQVVPDHQQEQRAIDEPVPVGLPELHHGFRLPYVRFLSSGARTGIVMIQASKKTQAAPP